MTIVGGWFGRGRQVMACHIVRVGEIEPLSSVAQCFYCIHFGGQGWVDRESVVVGKMTVYFLDLVGFFFFELFPLSFFCFLFCFFESAEESLSTAAVRPFLCWLDRFRRWGFGGDFFGDGALCLAPRWSFFAFGWCLICWPSFERSVLMPLSWLASSFCIKFFTVAGSAAASVSIIIAVSAEAWLTAKARSWASTFESAARLSISCRSTFHP